MAIEHTELPIAAVQFHPESILTGCGNIDSLDHFSHMNRRYTTPNAPCVMPYSLPMATTLSNHP